MLAVAAALATVAVATDVVVGDGGTCQGGGTFEALRATYAATRDPACLAALTAVAPAHPGAWCALALAAGGGDAAAAERCAALSWAVPLAGAGEDARAAAHALGNETATAGAVAAAVRVLEAAPDDAQVFDDVVAFAHRAVKEDAAATTALVEVLVGRFAERAASHHVHGQYLKFSDRKVESIAAFERALEMDPSLPLLHLHAGVAFATEGALLRGIHHFEISLEHDREDSAALSNLVFAAANACYWRNYYEHIAELEVFLSSSLDDPASTPIFEPLKASRIPLDVQIIKRLSIKNAQDQVIMSGGRLYRPPEVRTPGRLRVGYLSSDFVEHPVGHNMRHFFRFHNRARFEVFCYANRPSDESPTRADIEAGCEHFFQASPPEFSTLALTKLIQSHDIDILVNLNGWTKSADNVVFAMQPARVQVQWQGFPGTLGADYIPFLIADAVVVPPALYGQYTETVINMPHSYLPNGHAITNSHILTVPPNLSRTAARLPPDDVFLFCSFVQPFKIDPATFTVWMNILRRTPGSMIWLLRFEEEAETSLRAEAEAQGIDPERLFFTSLVPRKIELYVKGLADVHLDTPVYNGHVTTADVLWSGVPIITMPGTTFQSRVAASQAIAAGFPEMVVDSYTAYEDLAVRWATDGAALASLTDRLRAARTTAPLFDLARFVRDFEGALDEVWERGQPSQ